MRLDPIVAEDSDTIEFSFVFRDSANDEFGMRGVGVYIGQPTKEGPVMVVPITGELTVERKRFICQKLMEALHACMGEGSELGGIVRVGGG